MFDNLGNRLDSEFREVYLKKVLRLPERLLLPLKVGLNSDGRDVADRRRRYG
jgi:hypothetical protein